MLCSVYVVKINNNGNASSVRCRSELSWSNAGPASTGCTHIKPTQAVQCWPNVCDAGPTLKHHCFNMSCLLGCLYLFIHTLYINTCTHIYIIVRFTLNRIIEFRGFLSQFSTNFHEISHTLFSIHVVTTLNISRSFEMYCRS